MTSKPDEPIMIFGEALFSQASATSPVVVALNITFFPSTDPIVGLDRGIHIHTFGVSNAHEDPAQACESAGPHWNPTGVNHGSVTDSKSHIGDLGNVKAVNGKIVTRVSSTKLSLFGENSIIGRSIVLHEKVDDQGTGSGNSLKNGNSGSRIACGTIGIIN